ncbi:Ankyrin repeat domain-containing protein 6 [Hondaea fermentalgiana]|uniref:Ankyrin repeat domain-containing protein 6 n=1 Tax=Hondaea fermentalgiana TaxID=2315210 RepID=A0A2R5GNQ7_9STRA|nr:Ankyrin repeat domain-containing protein 6 [Hondaea fermentalgiana]|eukprot:GBG29504.1 Ankyrin repeat domain-containing protein 6 [Hondaea fermentalgiana]
MHAARFENAAQGMKSAYLSEDEAMREEAMCLKSSLQSHKLGALDEDDGSEREDGGSAKREDLLKEIVAKAKTRIANRCRASLDRDWHRLKNVDAGRIGLASQKAVLLRLKPEKLDQIHGYFTSRIWAVKKEGGRREGLDRVEVASIAWQALMESAPAVAQIMGSVKADYDRRVLAHVMAQEHAAIAQARLIAEQYSHTEDQGPAQLEFGEVLMVLTLSMEDLVQKARAASHHIGDVFANLWMLVLQLLRDLGTQRRTHLRKCAQQKAKLSVAKEKLNKDLCETLIQHDALVSHQKKEARGEILRLQARLRTTESRFNYQKMKMMIREGDIQKLRQQENRLKRKTIALVNRRMVREIVDLAHRVEDAHVQKKESTDDHERLQKELDEALDRHRELQEELVRVFAPPKEDDFAGSALRTKKSRDRGLQSMSRKRKQSSIAGHAGLMKVSSRLSQRMSAVHGLASSPSSASLASAQRDKRITVRKRQQKEVERKEKEVRKALLGDSQNVLDDLLGRLQGLEHDVNHVRPLRADVRTRNARVQVSEADLYLQKSATGDCKRRWAVCKGGWTTKRKLPSERGNPFVPPEFMALMTNLPVAYKAKRAPLKTVRRLIYQMLEERPGAGSDGHQDDAGAAMRTSEGAQLSRDVYRSFVRNFFARKYGLPQIAEPKLVDFLDALRNATREECALADLFCRMIGIERVVADAEADHADFGLDGVEMAPPIEALEATDIAFVERLMAILVAPGPEGTPQGPIEEKETGRLYVDLVNLEEAFPRVTKVLSGATRSALWEHLHSRFAESLRLNPKVFVLPKGARRGTSLDVLPVDEVLETVLSAWQTAKQRTRDTLHALFVAADVAHDGILTDTQFALVTRAVNPGLSKLAVEELLNDALRRGTNAETVQREDFVAACFAHEVYSASDWDRAEGGLAKLARKDGVRSDRDLTLRRLRAVWEVQETQAEDAMRALDAEAVTSALEAQLSAHHERIRHFKHLVARAEEREEHLEKAEEKEKTAQESGTFELLDVEACWFALWILRYELDKVRREKEVSTALGSVHYLMRWKLRMREILGLDNDAPTSSIFLAKGRRKKELVHPVFSRCRWHRTDDFLAFLNGNKVFHFPEDGEGSGTVETIEDETLIPLEINTADDCGNTLLHVAVQNGHDDYVQVLLDRGVNVDWQNMTGQTAMHFAKAYEHKRIFFMLRFDLDNS